MLKQITVPGTVMEVRVCDFCGSDALKCNVGVCCGCRKDICSKCWVLWEVDLFDGEGYDDYPAKSCTQCEATAFAAGREGVLAIESARIAAEEARRLWRISRLQQQ